MSRRRKGRIRSVVFVGFFILLLLGIGLTILYFYFPFDFSSTFPYKGEIPSYVLNSTISDFERELGLAGVKFTSISLMDDESGISVSLENGIMVIFSNSKSASYQVSSLQSILKSLTINNVQEGADGQAKALKIPKSIDFRYSKPIVNF